MLIPLLMLIIFTIVLAKAADIVVDSTSKLSKYLGISQVALGLVLVAIITSLPELSIAITSASAGEGAISAGNVFGSNIANILLVMGIGAFLYGFRIPWKNVGEIALILLLTTIISVYIIFSNSIQGWALGLYAGITLLAIFAGYVYYMMRSNRKMELGPVRKKVDRKKAATAFFTFIAGIVVVFISSSLVVDNAVITAKSLGIAESLIGATIIAVGTSLPELSTTLQAVRRKKYGVAAGNLIGSNMTNLTLVLGATAVISEIHVALPIFIAALLFAIVANAILLYFAAVRKNLGKYTGILFIAIYALFIIAIIGLQASEIPA